MGAVILQLLIKTTLASSLAIAVVLALRVPLRNYCGVRVAYTIWCLVPLALIAVLLPAREIVVAVASQPGTMGAASNVVTTLAPVSPHDSLQDVFLVLWATGLVICGFRFLRQQRKFISSLGLLHHRGKNIFLAANNNQGPSVIGVLQPRIVLPADFDERYSLEEQKLVLSHEKAHMARGDTRVNLFAASLRCIFWFNPLLHWADGRFRFDQELSTDANVLLKFPSARKSYADAMLKTQMASIGLPVACHWQAHHPLKERILMLKKMTPGKIYRVSGFVLVTALCLGGAFTAWSVQPAKIITAPAKAAFLYETKMDLDVDGDTQKDIVIREAPGKPAMITQGEGDKRWSFEFTLQPLENNRVHLKSNLKRGDELMGKPELIFELGKGAGIGVSNKDGSSVFKLNMLVREWRNEKATAALTVTKKIEVRPFSEQGTVPDFTNAAPWRQKLKISYVIDPRRPMNKDEGC